MKRLMFFLLCIALCSPSLRAEKVVASKASQKTTQLRVSASVKTPSQSVPFSLSPACVSSRTHIVFGTQHGAGCRETVHSVWASQGCTAEMGCCTDAAGCLVPSPSNSVRGDGIY